MVPSTSTTAAQPGPSGQAAAAASEIKDHFNTLEDLTNFLVTEKEQGAKSNLLTRTYPANVASLNKAIFKDVDVFKTDQNYSLVRQVIDRAPRWLIKKSTSTYLTLDLADISKQVGLEAEVVRSVVLSMVESGDINASIAIDGTVTFVDSTLHFTKADIDKASLLPPVPLQLPKHQATRRRVLSIAALFSRVVGVILAITSGPLIGSSFVLKKKGLLRSQEGKAAGEGVAYLKSPLWWLGMIMMIAGELCNFAAYALIEAIVVTPTGALSVVISPILSSFFLRSSVCSVVHGIFNTWELVL